MNIFMDEGPIKNFIMEQINKNLSKVRKETFEIDKNKIEFIMDNLEELYPNKTLVTDDVLDFAIENNLDLNDRELDYINLILL